MFSLLGQDISYIGSVTVDGEPGYSVTVCTAEPGVVSAGIGGFDVTDARRPRTGVWPTN